MPVTVRKRAAPGAETPAPAAPGSETPAPFAPAGSSATPTSGVVTGAKAAKALAITRRRPKAAQSAEAKTGEKKLSKQEKAIIRAFYPVVAVHVTLQIYEKGTASSAELATMSVKMATEICRSIVARVGRYMHLDSAWRIAYGEDFDTSKWKEDTLLNLLGLADGSALRRKGLAIKTDLTRWNDEFYQVGDVSKETDALLSGTDAEDALELLRAQLDVENEAANKLLQAKRKQKKGIRSARKYFIIDSSPY